MPVVTLANVRPKGHMVDLVAKDLRKAFYNALREKLAAEDRFRREGEFEAYNPMETPETDPAFLALVRAARKVKEARAARFEHVVAKAMNRGHLEELAMRILDGQFADEFEEAA